MPFEDFVTLELNLEYFLLAKASKKCNAIKIGLIRSGKIKTLFYPFKNKQSTNCSAKD